MAGRASTTRNVLPVLSGVRLSLTGDRLSVTGSDLELTITSWIEVAGVGRGHRSAGSAPTSSGTSSGDRDELQVTMRLVIDRVPELNAG